MRKLLLGLTLIAAATACSKDAEAPNENLLMRNDFESLNGWGIETPSLTKERAHSGQYSLKTDKDVEYSLTYRNVLGRLTAAKPKKVRLTGWVYRSTDDADAVLTMQVIQSPQDGTLVHHDGIGVKELAKKSREWVKISRAVELPDKVGPGNEVKIYLWRVGNGDAVFLDDLEFTIEP